MVLCRNSLFAGIVLILSMSAGSPAVSAGDPGNGAYVFKAAGCQGCHTAPEDKKNGVLLAGGRAFKTPFGTYYSPNITPHATGLGDWREDDFVNALKKGENPDGDNYFPVFPYVSYTKMQDKDIRDLWAYMKTLKPVERANRDHDVNILFGSRFLMTFWKWVNFNEGPVADDASRPASWNRGRYLVDALAHCTECHTPRNFMGGLKNDLYLAGNAEGPEGDPVPNITPDKESGLGDWTADDYDSLLSMGMLPDGDFVGASMAEAVENTENLTDDDRRTVIEYLLSVNAIHNKVKRK